MKVKIMPRTGPGKWSVWLMAAFVVLFVVFRLAATGGEGGGEGLFDNPLLTISVMLAGITGTASFFTGLVSVIRYGERSILVYPAMIIGLCVLLLVVAEIAFA
jgi:hypothetical protein